MKGRVVICRATPVAPDPRVDKIARSLQRGGFEVRVLGWDMTGQHLPEEHINGVPYQRRRVKAEFGRGLQNVTHQLRWQASLFAWLASHRPEYDLVHACDFDTVLPALAARQLWGKKVVYDIFDYYADMLRATPAPVLQLIRGMDRRAIEGADAVILADDVRIEQIAPARPRRLAVLYNCLEDMGRFFPEARPEGDPLRISYVGNLQVERGLNELLWVLSCRPDFILDLAGFGGDEAGIAAEAERLPNVTWHGRISYEQSLILNSHADVLIATYDPRIPNNRYSSPNKVFEAMLLGKPVVVARGTHMDRLIEREECGLVVEYGSREDLEAALTRLQQDPGLRSRLGKNARRAFERTYNWPRMEERLLALYEEVLA